MQKVFCHKTKSHKKLLAFPHQLAPHDKLRGKESLSLLKNLLRPLELSLRRGDMSGLVLSSADKALGQYRENPLKASNRYTYKLPRVQPQKTPWNIETVSQYKQNSPIREVKFIIKTCLCSKNNFHVKTWLKEIILKTIDKQ